MNSRAQAHRRDPTLLAPAARRGAVPLERLRHCEPDVGKPDPPSAPPARSGRALGAADVAVGFRWTDLLFEIPPCRKARSYRGQANPAPPDGSLARMGGTHPRHRTVPAVRVLGGGWTFSRSCRRWWRWPRRACQPRCLLRPWSCRIRRWRGLAVAGLEAEPCPRLSPGASLKAWLPCPRRSAFCHARRISTHFLWGV